MGPSTVPCERPDVTDCSSEQSPSKTTVSVQLIRKDEIHLKAVTCTVTTHILS